MCEWGLTFAGGMAAGMVASFLIALTFAGLAGTDIPPCELVHSWTEDMVPLNHAKSVMEDFQAAGYTEITATQQGSYLAIKGAC